MRSGLAQTLAVGLALCSLSAAAAKTIRVPPGAGTPLQDAIDAAAPGDVIRLEEAEYLESIVIRTRLRLVGARPTPPLRLGSRIDAQCGAATALEIAADDVMVKGVSVRGGSLSSIRVGDRAHVTLRDVTVSEPAFFGCGAVEYGIDVVGSRDVRILGCSVLGDGNGYTGSFGYRNPGIHLGRISADGDVRVRGPHDGRSTSSSATRGASSSTTSVGTPAANRACASSTWSFRPTRRGFFCAIPMAPCCRTTSSTTRAGR
jgi:hypothetical protein